MRKLHFLLLLFVLFLLPGCSMMNKNSSTTRDPDLCKIIFDSTGGTPVSSQDVRKYERIAEPEIPYRDGYYFGYWTYNGEVWDFFMGVATSDMTLKANWFPYESVVHYYENGEEIYTDYVVPGEYFYIGIPDNDYYCVFTGEFAKYSNYDEVLYNFDGDIRIDVIRYDSLSKYVYQIENNSIKITGVNYNKRNIKTSKLCSEYKIDGRKYSVTTIDTSAFLSCNQLESIILPDSITTIKDRAFSGLVSLESIYIPKNVTYIGEDIFSGCDNIQTIEVDKNNTKYDSRNNSNAIIEKATNTLVVGCNNSTIPNGITKIGDYAFNHSEISDLNLPNTLKVIGKNAFSFCNNIEHITFPNGLELIDESAFQSCTNLTEVTIPGSVKIIGKTAFGYCTSLASITLEEGIETIDQDAFCYSSPLKTITIPNSVTYIGLGAFRECNNLESITLPFVGREPKNKGDSFKYPFGYIFANFGNGTNEQSFKNNIMDVETSKFNIPISLKNVTITSGTYIVPNAFKNFHTLESITLPDTIKEIDSGAFYYCDNLSSINIPDSVEVIGDSVFYCCRNLSSITLSENLKYLGADSFNQCYALKNITIKNKLKTIGSYAFKECTSLESIILPNSLEEIGDEVFYNCKSLKSITLPFIGNKSVVSDNEPHYPFIYLFGTREYTDCVKVIQHYSIGNYDLSSLIRYVPSSLEEVNITSTTNLYNFSFADCQSIKTITLPDGLVTIGKSAFKNCTSLEELVIPDEVTSIGDDAFLNCSSLEELLLPGTLTSIGNNAFKDCTSLVTLRMYNGVTSIGDAAFNNCSSLTALHISSRVTTIPKGLLSGCSSLASLEIPFIGGSEPNKDDKNFDTFGYIFGTKDYSGAVAVSQAYNSNDQKNTYYIPYKLTNVKVTNTSYIPTGSFDGCERLLYITIPDSVDEIGDYAFRNCDSLTAFIMPNFVTKLGRRAFYDCDNLENLKISSRLTTIGFYAFENSPKIILKEYGNGYYLGCDENEYVALVKPKDTSITSCTINENCRILIGSFSGCMSLDSVSIPNSVISIGAYAFFNCSSLTSITMGTNVKNIGDSAFSGCSGLTTVEVPISVNRIGAYAFSDCYSLTSISLPFVGEYRYDENDLEQYPLGYIFSTSSFIGSTRIIQSYIKNGRTYDQSVYYIPSSLKTVYITNTTYVQRYAFENCTTITNVNLWNGIKKIDDYAFNGCTSLASVNMPNDLLFIGACAFNKCSQLESVTFNSKLETIERYAFANCTKLETITIPANVSEIYANPFMGCSSIESITVSSSNNYYDSRNNSNAIIETSSDELVSACKNTVIPSNIKRIGNSAFSSITISTITIPSGLIGIGSDAFYLTQGITKLTINDLKAWCNVGFYNEYSNPMNRTHKFYMNNEAIKDLVIPEGVAEIRGYAFYGCTYLETVTIPSGVTSIGYHAFDCCTHVTTMSLPSTLEYVGYKAFDFTKLEYYEKNSCLYLGNPSNNCVVLVKPTVITLGNCIIDSNCKIIYNDAFSDCTSLTGIDIPSGLKYIGYDAFKNCSSLLTITIPDNTAYSGSNLFSGCSSLTSITLPYINGEAYDPSMKSNSQLGRLFGSVSYDRTYIVRQYNGLSDGSQYFTNNYYIPYSLKTVTITKERYISPTAFQNCSYLTTINIPNTVTWIGSYAFYHTGISSIQTLEGLTYVGDYAFADCSELTAFTIPASVTYIGKYAFNGCSSLESIQVPNGIETIYESTFSNCTSLKTITIPNSVKTIGDNAFYSCTSLESITLPTELTSIGKYALSYCSSIKTLTIPNSIDQIDKGLLCGCSSLESITIPFIGERRYNLLDDNQYPLGYIFGYDRYDGSYNINQAFISIYGYVKTTHSFYIPQSLTEVIVTDVTYIQSGAFYNCSHLETIILPEGVTYIGDEAFDYNRNLKTLSIPSSITYIGDKAFYLCDSLEYNVYEHGSYLGNANNPYVVLMSVDSKELVEFTISNNCKIIYDGVFSNLSDLKTITIPSTITMIGKEVFKYCETLESIIIPSSVEYIGDKTFYYCREITIYVSLNEKPESWDDNWNSTGCTVEWGYKQ